MTDTAWRKSSYSGATNEMHCVEVAPWRTSSHSAYNGSCVEAAACRCGIVVRDSKDPGGAVLAFPPDAWAAFIAGLR